MRASLSSASITVATPSSFALGQIQSARSRSSGFASSTAIPKPASAISSMSFSPSPNETTRSSEMPSCCGDERDARPLRHRGVAELEEVGEGGRQEEAIAERRRRAPRGAPGSSAGSATATSFVGGCVSQAARSPTSSTGRCWKSAYIREYSVCSARRGGRRRNSSASARARSSSRDRLARGLERDRLVEHERAARRVDDGGALVTDDEVGDARLVRDRAGPSGTSGPWPRPRGSRAACERVIAARVRGRRSAVRPTSVRSKSQANAWTSRGKDGGRISRRLLGRRTRRRPRSAGR